MEIKKSLKGWVDHDDFGISLELLEILIGGIIVFIMIILFLKRVVWS